MKFSDSLKTNEERQYCVQAEFICDPVGSQELCV